jgi:hypothetical protein
MVFIGDPRLGRRGAAAHIERFAFGADRAGILSHAADEADLEFERGVACACRQHGVNRKSHRRIQQRRGVAAMHRTDRIVMPEGGNAVHRHDARLGAGIEGLNGLQDRRRRQPPGEDRAHEIDARHQGHHWRGRDAVFGLGGGEIVHGDDS